VYFHKNSLAEDEFEKLTPGVGVIYTETMGDKGPQASTVRIVERAKRSQERPHS
jgi:cold shock CspA family protein